jgi:CubicO group peptidase (beta-lactamase class C family)
MRTIMANCFRPYVHWLGFAICIALLPVAAPADETATPLPQPDANGTYLFWKPQEQLLGYRNIEKIFKTRTIARGSRVAPLPSASRMLDVRYQSNGESWTADTFMENTNAAGLLVLHRDQIVLERYRLGYSADQRWTSFSVGKSMSSTLAGAALKEGAIKSLEDPITNYLPGLKGSAYEGVTVRHLLNMTSGVKWNEDYADPASNVAMIRAEKSVNGSDPIVTYMARMPREAEPGTKFVYKTGETHLVGSLVRAATGKHLADYLSEKIWKPYGMEKDAVWMLDAAGNEFAGCCISATLRDFGRFGVFFKNGAKIDGVSIVPEGWVKQATTGSKASERYGFQWWLTNGPAYNAQGIFGQQIHINPERDLVVVIQSANATATDPTARAARAAFIEAVTAAVSR